jgi:hypothetical protein
MRYLATSLAIFTAVLAAQADSFRERYPDSKLEPLMYNNPGLVVDVGVGLWAYPLPVDYDNDGDHDLLLASPDTPYNGIYFFENTEGNVKDPVFKPGVWLCPAPRQLTISHLDSQWTILSENKVLALKDGRLQETGTIDYTPDFYIEGRDRQWTLVDYDGDGVRDLVIGASDWREYGWDNAFNEKGEWTRGPLHAHVYVIRNTGTNDAPVYGKSEQLHAGDKPIDVFGAPSPNFADFDGDGDLDLVCGEFLDKLTYFQNTGTRAAPQYAAGRYLEHDGEPIRMDLEMLQVAHLDWDKDGDVDLIVGQEDGRVALLEHSGEVKDGMPVFLPPRFFRQEAERVKIGALATVFAVDWDGDGDTDIVSGDTAGYINFVENLDGGNPPKWAAPVYLKAGGETVRIQAGPNGSIQGPAEAKWGYTVLNVVDWDHDGPLDIVLNSIWGEVLWYRNAGTRTAPELEKARPVEVAWEGETPKPDWVWWQPKGRQLVTQWRTTPFVIDLNKDGLNDLVMLDREGYLSFFERVRVDGNLTLRPPQRIFQGEDGQALRLKDRPAGGSGRRKFTMADWDQDGKLDILIDSKPNVDFLRNIGENGAWKFRNEGKVDTYALAGHDTCPTTVDWDKDGDPDLLIGAEDGFLYYLKNTVR